MPFLGEDQKQNVSTGNSSKWQGISFFFCFLFFPVFLCIFCFAQAAAMSSVHVCNNKDRENIYNHSQRKISFICLSSLAIGKTIKQFKTINIKKEVEAAST